MPLASTVVSAIVIGRDEAAALKYLLPRLLAMPGVREVIFCDGGSRDDSQSIAREAGAEVLTASGGRGAQLRAGADAARGEVLWFLHADATPHRSGARAIERACRDPQVLGGNFRLRFRSPSFWARAFEVIARTQRILGIHYGDSGQWARRVAYDEMGGFAPWPLFEDFDFARRLEVLARRRGGRTVCLRPAIGASARRFEAAPWKILRLWMRMQWMYGRGARPEELAREYHGKR